MVLLIRYAATPYLDFAFRGDDVLLLRRESHGVSDEVRTVIDCGIRIPTRPGLRSLNVATAAAIVLSEALRQLDAFPRPDDGEDGFRRCKSV